MLWESVNPVSSAPDLNKNDKNHLKVGIRFREDEQDYL